MKRSQSLIVVAVALLAVIAICDRANGGSYAGIAACSSLAGEPSTCTLTFPFTQPGDPACTVTPFGVVYPVGYTGVETTLHVRICANGEDLEPAVKRAIATWEAMEPVPENCVNCVVREDDPGADHLLWAEPVILHELGHCALGLDHINRTQQLTDDCPPPGNDTYAPSSFTRSANVDTCVEGIDVGADGIRGSIDDFHDGQIPDPIADSVSWFRHSDMIRL